MAALKKEIGDLERTAKSNLGEWKEKVECAVSDLDGLKEDFIGRLEKVEGKEGYVYISMKYPEVLPAMKLCKNADIRAKLHKAFEGICYKENSALLTEIVAKRQ